MNEEHLQKFVTIRRDTENPSKLTFLPHTYYEEGNRKPEPIKRERRVWEEEDEEDMFHHAMMR